MKKNLRLLKILTSAYWQQRMEYRLGSLIWILNGMVGPMLSLAIWLIVSASSNLALSQPQLVTYFFLTQLIGRLTQVWVMDFVGEWIKDGGLSVPLLKPYNYLIDNFSQQIGEKAIRLAMLVPVMVVLWCILQSHLDLNFSLVRILIGLVAIVAGFLMHFILEHALALVALWAEDIHQMQSIYDTLRGLFSGSIIPLALMPGILKTAMSIFPSRFLVSFPLEIIVENISPRAIVSGFIILLSWLICSVLAYQLLFKKGIKKYQAIGG